MLKDVEDHGQAELRLEALVAHTHPELVQARSPREQRKEGDLVEENVGDAGKPLAERGHGLVRGSWLARGRDLQARADGVRVKGGAGLEYRAANSRLP